MFPKSSVRTEERLHEILAALDKLAAPEQLIVSEDTRSAILLKKVVFEVSWPYVPLLHVFCAFLDGFLGNSGTPGTFNYQMQ